MNPLRTGLGVLIAAAFLVLAPLGVSARGAGGHGGGGGRGGGGTMMHQSGAGEMHGGGWHGGYGGSGHGWHGGQGWHGHSGFFVDAYFYDPFLFPFYAAPYYPYPYYPYWNPPYDDQADGAPPPEESAPSQEAPPQEAYDTSSYGLVQLRGVPDGAAVYLDDRFWLEARDLDDRWLALPSGTHRLSVRPRDGTPIDRDVGVTAGSQVVVRFDRRR